LLLPHDELVISGAKAEVAGNGKILISENLIESRTVSEHNRFEIIKMCMKLSANLFAKILNREEFRNRRCQSSFEMWLFLNTGTFFAVLRTSLDLVKLELLENSSIVTFTNVRQVIEVN
jgi:hypothetical protein